jgi:SAM-dependent methyltransferase
MAHKEQIDYINKVKEKFPKYFKNKKVLGVGTFNVCGSEDTFFDDCDYAGLDLGPGEGVDIVCPAQDYDAPDASYDTIISCECFEHNPFYKETIQNIVRLLKPGGMFLFTCATTGRPVHGTKLLEEESLVESTKNRITFFLTSFLLYFNLFLNSETLILYFIIYYYY